MATDCPSLDVSEAKCDFEGRNVFSSNSPLMCESQQDISSVSMEENKPMIFNKQELITSPSTAYKVQALLGSGSYGVVIQCLNMTTKETVALKVTKSQANITEAKLEEGILKIIKALNSEKFNVIRFNDAFRYKELYCLDFEKLDINLHEFMQMHQNCCLQLMEIRPILQQLATALDFLKSANIIHADLKPENIMLVDHKQQPLKVKIIDFSLAIKNPIQAWKGVTLQSRFYRSPEVLLGTDFNEAIDIWSLGCVAIELAMGKPIFSCDNEYDLMSYIINTIGMPPHHMLDVGYHTKLYFRKKRSQMGCKQWRFKPALITKYLDCDRHKIIELKKVLQDLSGDTEPAYHRDIESFVSISTQMLVINPSDRITATQILQHPFITMSHLDADFNNSHYTISGKNLMSICQGQRFNGAGDGAQTTQQMHLSEITVSERSPDFISDNQYCLPTTTINPARKRKKSAERGNSSDSFKARRKRTEYLEAKPMMGKRKQLRLPKAKTQERQKVW